MAVLIPSRRRQPQPMLGLLVLLLHLSLPETMLESDRILVTSIVDWPSNYLTQSQLRR